MRLPNLKEISTGAALLTAAATPMEADADPVVNVTFGQAGGNSEAYFNIRNNDAGVTYDSGELKFDELLTGVAQAVKDNNSDYTTMSLDDIKGEWAYGVSLGEVDGWQSNLDSGVLNLTHPDEGYIPWLSSEQFNGDYDELPFTVNFFDQLDFNHNGQYDANFEQLAQMGPLVENAFTGYNNIGQGISTDANALNVIPEPTAISLILGAGVAMLAAKRYFSKGK